MQVFLTGATGYVGAAIARALVAAGHRVSGLVRSEAAAARAKAASVAPVRGDLRAPEAWVATAVAHDAIVHAAFEYRADGTEADDADRKAVATLLKSAVDAPCRHFIYTSNAFLLADLAPGADPPPYDETVDPSRATRSGRWRLTVEQQVQAAAGAQLRCAVIRVGAVYGGDGGSLPDLFAHAKRTRTLRYIDRGENRWSFIHCDDLAALYAAVLTNSASGIFHGVDGVPLSTREMMTIVGEIVGPDVVVDGCPAADAKKQLPYHASVLTADLALVTPRALALGWFPRFDSFSSGASPVFAHFFSPAAPNKS